MPACVHVCVPARDVRCVPAAVKQLAADPKHKLLYDLLKIVAHGDTQEFLAFHAAHKGAIAELGAACASCVLFVCVCVVYVCL